MMRTRRILAASFVAFSLVAGCSLVNSFDDPKAQNPDASALADAAPDVAEETSTGQDGGDAAVSEGGSDAGVERGVIVVGGQGDPLADGGTLRSVLTAIDPTTGAELPKARETMNVSAVLYDGLRDVWYVFESTSPGPFPLPDTTVFLHVRTLDPVTGSWKELQKLKVPPHVSFALMSVLRDRIVYVAYRPADGGVADAAVGQLTYDLVTLDTTHQEAVTAYDEQPLTRAPTAMVGTRSETGSGGRVTMAQPGACEEAAGSCHNLIQVLVPANAPPQVGLPQPTNLAGGGPGLGSWLGGGPSDVLVTKGFAPSAQAVVAQYSPLTFDLTTITTATYPMTGANIHPLAIAECLSQAFVVETNADLNVYAVPLSVTTSPLPVAKQGTGHSGQGVYFEPFTSTVIAPFNQGPTHTFTAFTLAGTAAQPTLAPRTTDWTPPADLRPQVLATRTPIPFSCK